MPELDVNITRGGQARIFIQEGGASPANPYIYMGCMSLDDGSKDLGEPDPVYCPSSEQRDAWDIVDEIPKAESLGTSSFTQHMDRFLNDVWWDIKERRCKFNMQAILTNCNRPDDIQMWDAKILYDNTRMTNMSHGAFNPLSGDDNAAVDITGSLTYRDLAPIRQIKFGEVLDTLVLAEVLDGVYNDVISCGDCGTPSDGCQKFYLLTLANSGSPGLSSQIVRSLDGGSTGIAIDIPVFGGLSGNRLAPVGNRLVVISQANGGHAHSLFSNLDAGVVSWSLVTTGYVATKGPRAIFSLSPAQTFIAAAGGYIYLMTDPTKAVTVLTDGSISTQDLNDIHGKGRTIIAVGGSNAMLVSRNRGVSFSAVTGPKPGIALNTVFVFSDSIWFVGTADGDGFYTINGGVSWTEFTPDAGITVFNKIRFFNDTVGYIAVQLGGVARVYRTTDSGATWHHEAPSISGLPTAERINVVVPCGNNICLAAGRISSAGDGLVAVAQ